MKKGDPVYSDDVEQGEVVSVSPSEGRSKRRNNGYSCNKQGNQPTKVPKLSGKSQSDAEAALSQAGLSGNATEDYSDTVEKDWLFHRIQMPEKKYLKVQQLDMW